MMPSQHAQLASSIPTPILEGFLYLGSYDNASRSDVLKIVGITHILNVGMVACFSTHM